MQATPPLSLEIETQLNFDRPTVRPAFRGINRLTLGDGHGDDLKFFDSLVHFRVLRRNDAASAAIKAMSQKDLTAQDRQRLHQILQTLTIEENIEIRDLGDRAHDRGPGHAYITIEIGNRLAQLTKMIRHIGNHEREMCDMIENDKLLIERKDQQFAFQFETGMKLGDMLRSGVITVQEIKERYAIYRQCFVLLSYSLRERPHRKPKITVYCHGPRFDLRTLGKYIVKIDPHFPVHHFKDDVHAIARAIDLINQALARAPKISEFIAPQTIPMFWIWERGYQGVNNEHDPEAYDLEIKHGHDQSTGRGYVNKRADGTVLATYRSYDDNTGKGSYNSGPIFVHASLAPASQLSQSDAVDEEFDGYVSSDDESPEKI